MDCHREVWPQPFEFQEIWSVRQTEQRWTLQIPALMHGHLPFLLDDS